MTETTARTYHTMESLRQMAQTDLRNVNRKELVDINDVESRKTCRSGSGWSILFHKSRTPTAILTGEWS